MKQPSPDLFIAQKTMQFALCLYNPCFPASAKNPDKDETNKMPVGSPLAPRANCTGVRNSSFSGLSSPFAQGAHGKSTGQGEEQNHRLTQEAIPKYGQLGPAPIPDAQQSLVTPLPHAGTYPQDMEQPELPETAAPFASNAETILGRSQYSLVCLMAAAQCAWKGTEVCRASDLGAGKIRLELYLSISAYSPYRSSKHVSTGTILTNTERRDENSLSGRQERCLVS